MGQHAARRFVVAVVAGLIGLLLTAARADAAIAGAGKNGTSACNTAWGSGWASSSGGDARYSFSWSGDVTSSRMHISSGQVVANHLIDCRSGYAKAAYRIKVQFVLTINGSALSSCGVSIPAGFSCTANGTTQTWRAGATCATYVTSCTAGFGPVYLYPPGGGRYSASYSQENVTLYRSDGQTYSFSSPRLSSGGP